jgi:hypothetical protein
MTPRRPLGPVVPLPPPERDPAQAAWDRWVQLQYFDRDVMPPAHRAFLAGWAAADAAARAAIAFKDGIIADLSADVDRLERER